MPKNLVMFGRVVFEIYMYVQTDKQTDILVTILCIRPGEEVMRSDGTR